MTAAVNVQIFGKSKCFETKKAQRYFKERRIKFQDIDVVKYGMSRGEFNSVCQAIGFENMVDIKAKDSEIFQYLAYDNDKLDKLYENQYMLKTPIVRNGKKATVGYCPDVWKSWE